MSSKSTSFLLASSLSLLGAIGSGCVTDVGACDQTAARRVVYRLGASPTDPQNGLPMYEGQALVTASCGNAQYCHSSSAEGTMRFGVPEGFDLDFGLACVDDSCPPFDRGIIPFYPESYEHLERLHQNQRTALHWARHILRTIDVGSMPPGAEGNRIAALGPNYSIPDFRHTEPGVIHADGLWVPCDDDPATADVPDCVDELARLRGNNVSRVWDRLPKIDSSRGREIVRNWLACGAPVVESTSPLNATGVDCSAAGDTVHVGDCIGRMPLDLIPPEANWASIYERVIGPLCGESCHIESDPASYGRSQLDLSNIDAAFEVLRNSRALGDDCKHPDSSGNVPLYIDVANPSASLLYTKMVLSDEAVCGDRMIPGVPALPADITDPILAWIAAGAPR